ncbi:hypothetical protein C3L33_06860, partial [Rhododendron williamsianum]
EVNRAELSWMDCALKCVALLVLLGCAFSKISASLVKDDYEHCKNTVNKWASSSPDLEVKEEKHRLRDLLFFLHVPRTGGRTYFHWTFLLAHHSVPLHFFHLNVYICVLCSKHNCRLLVTHDDYSMMSRLPMEKTSVVTILRNPIDRVFSTYEFSIEVAARFLVHPNLTSVARMAGRLRSKQGGVSTLDIWPWKYLVPWMREDLFARNLIMMEEIVCYITMSDELIFVHSVGQRDARELQGLYSRSNDSYNMEDTVMPLHEYINDPIARDIIHNGATFQVLADDCIAIRSCYEVLHMAISGKFPSCLPLQVGYSEAKCLGANSIIFKIQVIAGLTNNSYIAEAHEVRRCVLKHQTLGEYVLEVAKKRLDNMLYVGLTEDHRESATMFANVVGAQKRARLQNITRFVDLVSIILAALQNSSTDQNASKISAAQIINAKNEHMTVGRLMEAYETCISSLRRTQKQRRTASLKRISPANFSKEVFDVHRLDKVVMLLLSLTLLSFYPLQARLDVPEVVLQQIKSLNILDMELYRYAQSSFSKQHKQMMRQLKVSDNLFQDLFLASQYYCLCTAIPLVLDSHIHHLTTIHAMLYCQKYRSLEH